MSSIIAVGNRLEELVGDRALLPGWAATSSPSLLPMLTFLAAKLLRLGGECLR
jgi:hypothetical protein